MCSSDLPRAKLVGDCAQGGGGVAPAVGMPRAVQAQVDEVGGRDLRAVETGEVVDAERRAGPGQEGIHLRVMPSWVTEFEDIAGARREGVEERGQALGVAMPARRE